MSRNEAGSASRWRWLGIACLVATLGLGLIVVGFVPYYPEDSSRDELGTWVVGVSTFLIFAAVGALLLARLPGHPIGLLFALAPVAMMATNAAASYIEADPFDLPGNALLAALTDPLWQIGAASLGVYLPLLFPNGTYLGPRWRWAGWLGAIGLVLVFVTWAFRPGPLIDTEGYVNPIGIPGTRDLMAAGETVAWMLLLVAMLAGVVSLVLRFRRSRGVEREQMKWFVAAILFVIVLFLVLGPLIETFDVVIPDAVYLFLMALVPASVGLAILRYRLYDIDVIINRALVYGALTAVLAGLYAASIQLFKMLFEGVTGQTSDAAIILTTLVLAAAFTPAKSALQKAVALLRPRP